MNAAGGPDGAAGGEALGLGQRLVQILEVGKKTSTYKIAVLLALIDVSMENLPDDPGGPLEVSLRDLADRVIATYWPQVRPYLGDAPLRQNSQSGRGIPEMVAELRRHAHDTLGAGLGSLVERADGRYVQVRDNVAVRLAEMPLTHLQALPGGGDPFLCAEPWLEPRRSQSRATLAAHGWAITLLPGVAWHLASLSGLLRPVLQLAWESLVVRLNTGLERHDLGAILFGADRTAIAVLAPAMAESQPFRCFYCDRPLSVRSTHLDHVLPWSRIPLDAAANLVAADARCNLARSDAIPIPEHHARALHRDTGVLRQIAGDVVPVLHEATRRAGDALYRTSPPGTPFWQSPGVYRPSPWLLDGQPHTAEPGT